MGRFLKCIDLFFKLFCMLLYFFKLLGHVNLKICQKISVFILEKNERIVRKTF